MKVFNDYKCPSCGNMVTCYCAAGKEQRCKRCKTVMKKLIPSRYKIQMAKGEKLT